MLYPKERRRACGMIYVLSANTLFKTELTAIGIGRVQGFLAFTLVRVKILRVIETNDGWLFLRYCPCVFDEHLILNDLHIITLLTETHMRPENRSSAFHPAL